MRARRSRSQDLGFSFVELLVVMVVIALLAAIAIPVYLKQRQSAYRTTAVSDMRNVAIAIESYAAGNEGSYTALDGATEKSPLLTRGEGFQSSVWTRLSVRVTGRTYCVEGRHDLLPGNTLVYRNGRGVVEVLGSGAGC